MHRRQRPRAALGLDSAEWQRIAASIARRCGLKLLGPCDVHCLGLAVCDTTDLRPCCTWPPLEASP